MLQALDQLCDVGVRVIKASKVATIDSLRQLQPVLNQLAASGDDFVNAFNVFLTYPFVDEVVGRDPQVARNLHMGDYTNLSITLDLDLTQQVLPTNPTDVLPTQLDPSQVRPERAGLHRQRQPRQRGLPEGARRRPRPCSSSSRSARSRPTGTRPCACCSTPSPACRRCPALPGDPLSDSLGDVARRGARRPGPQRDRTLAPWNDAAHGGPTMAQLQTVYDPSLVNLLVPQLVAASDPATTAKGGERR